MAAEMQKSPGLSGPMASIAATRKTGGSVWGYKPLLPGQRLKALAFSFGSGKML
jgi:hypothetical protein